MSLEELVFARKSIRDFLSTPVSIDTINEVLESAKFAPSGGNLQPWHIHVVSGRSLIALKTKMRDLIQTGQHEENEYRVYPPDMPSPYNDRRKQIGEDMYAKLEIPKTDKPARRDWFQRNFEFFGAPMALFFTVDRIMGAPQWSDIGMLMQTIMLLLKEKGIDSCAQECWSEYPQTLSEFLQLGPERMLFCGMSVGYANPEHPVNQFRSTRAALSEFVSYLD